jgi:hypothetical protein
MEKLDYQAEVVFSSPEGKRGSTVSVEVRLDKVVGEVRKFQLTVPGQGFFVTLAPVADRPGVFAGSTLIPWEAPSGTYPLGLYGVDAEGNRGPALYASFKVV